MMAISKEILKRRASYILRPCSVLHLIVFCLTVWFAFFTATRLCVLPLNFFSRKGHSNSSDAQVLWEWEKRFHSHDGSEGSMRSRGSCDISSGRWMHDPQRSHQPYDHTCPYIFKGWNCLQNHKTNARDITAWRWLPWNCDLPQLDATLFLEHFRDKNIGFVGDSLNRNMFTSLICALKQVSKQVKKWRPAGADKAFTFISHNLTVAYHRTSLLADYGRWKAKLEGGQLERLGYKEGFRIDVDVPQSSWAQAPEFHDVLILNTGHWWWAPAKFNISSTFPVLFFRKGEPIVPPISFEDGFDIVLKHMLLYTEAKMQKNGLKFLRSQSPRHFEGGDWFQNGTCQRFQPLLPSEVDAFFAPGSDGPNIEMHVINQHLRHSLKGTNFHFLDISYISSFRADAHPSKSAGKVHEDCMHWCMPGAIDLWNDIFFLRTLNLQL